MKKTHIADILITVLASSSAIGALSSPAQAGKCATYCDYSTCTKYRECDGVRQNLCRCAPVSPLTICF